MIFAKLISALRAAKEDPSIGLERVPKVFWEPDTWSPEVFLELTKFHWTAVIRMPPGEITEEIARLAVSQFAEALHWIPPSLRTKDLCRLAVENDVGALKYVPSEFASALAENWLESACPPSSEWHRVPIQFRTREFLLRAINVDPLVIEHVPTNEHDNDICDAFLAGGDHPRYLEDIKPEARSRVLCIACLKAGRGSIDAVPRLLWGPDIVEANRLGQIDVVGPEDKSLQLGT
jgi:hypothetical protein